MLLFEKLEAVQVNTINILNDEDKAHCNAVFACYEIYLKHIVNTHATLSQINNSFTEDKRPSEETYYFSARGVSESIEKLQKNVEGLSDALIRNLEAYFKDHYNLSFKSFVVENKYPYKWERFIHASYKPIIDNIINQVGNDFSAIGKDRIKDQFRDCFYSESRKPKLSKSKITFPGLFWFETTWDTCFRLSYRDETIKKMFLAFALFFKDATEPPASLDTLRKEWERKIDLSITYTVDEGLQFKVFQNRRIDVTFPNAQQAAQFYAFFDLASTGKEKY